MRRLSKGMILWIAIAIIAIVLIWKVNIHLGLITKFFCSVIITCLTAIMIGIDTSQGLHNCMQDNHCPIEPGEEQIDDIEKYLPERMNAVPTSEIDWESLPG